MPVEKGTPTGIIPCLMAETWTTVAVIMCVLGISSQLLYYHISKQNIHSSDCPPETDSSTDNKNYVDDLRLSGSSIWCHGNNHTDRTCRFHNLCYVPSGQTFVFFQGSQTISHGIPAGRFEQPFLDLSSVVDHNAHLFSFEDVPSTFASEVIGRRYQIVDETSLLMSRFLPDNLMHVMHDDLLPVYHTIRELSSGRPLPAHVRLVFADSLPSTDFISLYGLFTISKPQKLSELAMIRDSEQQTVCFRELWVGLRRTSWYQYGFAQPQGPLPNPPIMLDILQFTTYVRNQVTSSAYTSKLNTVHMTRQCSDASRGRDLIVLVSRKETRQIINELQLSLALASDLKRTVVTVSLETHSMACMIEIFGRAVVVVGMHGSLLVLSMFMPQGSVLIELFPYGIPPENYTPYKTLADIVGLAYRSWTNSDVSRTVTHPDRPPELGGLTHLDPEIRTAIEESGTVSPHLCCSDPAWLYRINQDTIVDEVQVLALIHSALTEFEELKAEQHLVSATYPEHPGKVRELECTSNCDLTSGAQPCLLVTWAPPWNHQYLSHRELHYEVLVQIDAEEDGRNYVTEEMRLVLTGEWILSSKTYHIWIRAVLNFEHRGMFVYTTCGLSTN